MHERVSEILERVATVPAGRWAVGVSGGADSVALLLLLHARTELSLHVVHLDHQTRGEQSRTDARFVAAMAWNMGVAITCSTLREVEAKGGAIETNPSARYRDARMRLFGRVVHDHDLQGVILAHHADDQAETVMLRLLRGSGPAGLSGMVPDGMVNGLRILRPLLGVRADCLREYLIQRNQLWQEDASNKSDAYLRNQIRKFVRGDVELSGSLVTLGGSSKSYRNWLDQNAPELREQFATSALCGVPSVLAAHSAARWLIARGAPAADLNRSICDRLVAMCCDAGTPGRADFPSSIRVRRTRGIISVEK